MKEAAVLIGGPEFEADLKAAILDFQNLVQPMTKTASTIIGVARVTVPKLTGALAASMIPRADPMAAEVSSNIRYAGVVHWGYPPHNIRRNLWLLNAAHNTERQWVEYFNTYMEKVVSTMDKNYVL